MNSDYGLFHHCNYQYLPVPLEQVKFNGNIQNGIGEFKVQQYYKNNQKDKLLETTYIFPLSTNATIISAMLKIGDRELKSELIEKQKAREDYKEAVDDGKKAMLLEKNDMDYSIMIGNVEPGENIMIEYCYLQTLNYVDNAEHTKGHYLFVIPTNIAPKFNREIEKKEDFRVLSQDYFKNEILYNIKNTIKFNVDIAWKSDYEIKKIESLTHKDCKIDKKWLNKNEQSNDYEISMKGEGLLQDFNLLCYVDINDYNSFGYNDRKNTYNMFTLNINTEELNIPADDYTDIFILDCSGSMQSASSNKDKSKTKIEDAVNALKLLIASLKPGINYNIIKFGSKFEKFYKESVKYDKHNHKSTMSFINNIQANLGGTELYKLMNKVLDEANNITNIFIITDGQVGGREELLESMNKKIKEKTRIFVTGIGSDADRILCEKMAEIGKGTCSMMIDSTNLDATMIQQYKLSRMDYYSNVQIKNAHQSASRLYFLPGINNIYVKNGGKKTCELEYDMIMKKNNIKTLKIMENNNDLVKKLFACEMIKNIENGNNKYNIDLLKFSLEYGIMSEKTSFIVVDEKAIKSENEKLDLIRQNVPHYSERSMMKASSPRSSYKRAQLVGVSNELAEQKIEYAFNILDYVMFDGSFEINNKIIDLLGEVGKKLIKEGVGEATGQSRSDILKYNKLVYEYLMKENIDGKYDIVLEKLKQYLKDNNVQIGLASGGALRSRKYLEYLRVREKYLKMKKYIQVIKN
jgi:hypothetical protein